MVSAIFFLRDAEICFMEGLCVGIIIIRRFITKRRISYGIAFNTQLNMADKALEKRLITELNLKCFFICEKCNYVPIRAPPYRFLTFYKIY